MNRRKFLERLASAAVITPSLMPLRVKAEKSGSPEDKKSLRWSPQPGPQTEAIQAREIQELFYGGAAGGGKSDFLLGDFLQDIDIGTPWKGLLIRRTYGELKALLDRSHEIYPQTGAKWNSVWHLWK